MQFDFCLTCCEASATELCQHLNGVQACVLIDFAILLFCELPSAMARVTCAASCDDASAVRLGPEWGEPLRVCAECSVEGEVGAVDPDDSML